MHNSGSYTRVTRTHTYTSTDIMPLCIHETHHAIYESNLRHAGPVCKKHVQAQLRWLRRTIQHLISYIQYQCVSHVLHHASMSHSIEVTYHNITCLYLYWYVMYIVYYVCPTYMCLDIEIDTNSHIFDKIIQCHVLWRLSATSLFLPEAFGGSGNRLGESTEMTEVGSVVIATSLSVWVVGIFLIYSCFLRAAGWKPHQQNESSWYRER